MILLSVGWSTLQPSPMEEIFNWGSELAGSCVSVNNKPFSSAGLELNIVVKTPFMHDR